MFSYMYFLSFLFHEMPVHAPCLFSIDLPFLIDLQEFLIYFRSEPFVGGQFI